MSSYGILMNEAESSFLNYCSTADAVTDQLKNEEPSLIIKLREIEILSVFLIGWEVSIGIILLVFCF